MKRRSFIALTAVTGTSATLASCGNPEHQLIRFIPDEEHVPGVAEWKPSLCPLCSAGCGLTVRIMEGDAEIIRDGQTGLIKMGLAKKLEGNPAHPISQGKLCARGQAAIQVTYHPDRLTHPLKRSGARGSGQFQEISWDEATAQLIAQLDGLATAGTPRALAFLHGPSASHRSDLVAAFLDRFGAPPALAYELFGDEVLRRANLVSFGRLQLPTFDFASSRYVISFGADFLGTWNSPVAQSAAYGRMRQGRPGVRGTFVQLEPRMSQTGASADEWIPIKPGTEGVLALGLAQVMMAANLRPADAAGRAGTIIEGWNRGLPDYTPPDVERTTGVTAARIERLARALADQRPAVAVVSGAPLAHTNGLFTAIAINALNALLGSVGEPGGVSFMPQIEPAAGPRTAADRQPGDAPRTLSSWAAAILGGNPSPVQVALIDGTNPVFASPGSWRIRDALLKVPFLASFGSFLDETSMLADLVLPDHSFLESWTDGRPESGAATAVATLAPPAMRPLHQTRAMPDVLLQVAGRLARPLNPPLPWQTFEEMLMASYAALPAPSAEADTWTTAQQQGGWWGGAANVASPAAGSRVPAASRVPAVADRSQAAPRRYAAPQFDGDAAQYPFHFLPYASQAFLDGSLAHLPWLQEMPDVISTAMWCSWVEINTQTAARLGIAEGDVVEIGSAHGTLRAPALVSPGIAPDVIAMPVGQGHESYTRYASGRGENPIRILAPVTEPETGALAWAATRVRVSRIGRGDSELILFAGGMREHPEHER
ncbi:MAG: molybdopterin-dependent oxidoreductase [Acidobacteriota bacterium]